MRTRFTSLQRLWAPEGGSGAGAGESESGGASVGEKHEDGEKSSRRDEFNARFARMKSQAERDLKKAVDGERLRLFEELGVDDDDGFEQLKERVRASQTEVTSAKREATRAQRERDDLKAKYEAAEAWRKNRLIDDTIHQAFDAFRDKHGHRVIDSARSDMIAVLRGQLEVVDSDGTHAVVPLKDGQPLHGMKPGDFIAEQLQGRKYALEPTTAGGAGSRPGQAADRGKAKIDLGTPDGIGELWGQAIVPKK